VGVQIGREVDGRGGLPHPAFGVGQGDTVCLLCTCSSEQSAIGCYERHPVCCLHRVCSPRNAPRPLPCRSDVSRPLKKRGQKIFSKTSAKCVHEFAWSVPRHAVGRRAVRGTPLSGASAPGTAGTLSRSSEGMADAQTALPTPEVGPQRPGTPPGGPVDSPAL
jgi:hypothetical protein